MLTLGALSYSIYMVHIFVQARMINVAGLVGASSARLIDDFVLRGERRGFRRRLDGDGGDRRHAVATIAVSWITGASLKCGHGLVPPALETRLTRHSRA